jgi:octaprenyl-diphosphate synthase
MSIANRGEESSGLRVVVPIGEGVGKAAASIEPLVALTRDDMARVNEMILARAGSNVELIPQIARHLIDSGGKRLRPMLTVAAASMCGYEGENHVRLAASVEFMHTATLLHDDVVDESDLRRGRAAARLVWGNQASVLVGDYLLGQAFRMMAETGVIGALEILSNAAAVIAEGEVVQLGAARNTATTEDDYLAIIRSKTAALFAAAAELGPVLVGSDRFERAAFRSYGANLGLAFQLIDDALDYAGSASDLGKRVGDDFREGKITLPVVLAYRRGTDEDRVFWNRVLEDGEIGDGDLQRAIGIMYKCRAIADTIERASHFGAVAREALAPFPDSGHKRALVEAVDFCVGRAS